MTDRAISDAVGDLGEAAQFAHVAVQTRRGPHVTPVLFGLAGERLWFLVRRDSLKAKVLRRRPRAAIVVRSGELALLGRGDVHLIDALRPSSWWAPLPDFALAPFALGSFAARNPREVIGFALDALPGGAPPPDLVLASFAPRAVAVVRGDEIEKRRGRWAVGKRGARSSGPATANVGAAEMSGAIAALPALVRHLPGRAGDAVLGWAAPGGPIALPGRWDPGHRELLLAPEVRELTTIHGEAAACVAFDEAESRRPSGKRGVMIRGRGRAKRRPDGAGVGVLPERLTYWLGFDTGTVTVG